MELKDYDNRKYFTPKEVEDIYGIKANTLRRQRWDDYGLPYHKCSLTNKILYSIEDLEKTIKRIVPSNKKVEIWKY